MHLNKLAVQFATYCGLFVMFAGEMVGQNLWQQPQSGWLYVLDARGSSRDDAHIILVDPEAGISKGSITVGYAPQFVVSPDGLKIVVVSGSANKGEIAIYDPRSGRAIAKDDVPFRIIYSSWATDTTLALSRDGQWVFVETMQTVAEGSDVYGVQRFQIGNDFIHAAGHASLPGCGVAELIPVDGSDWSLMVHCGLSNILRLLSFDDTGNVSKIKDLALPVRPYDAASGQMAQQPLATRAISYSGSGDSVLALSGSNEICRLDVLSGAGPCSTLLNRMLGRWIPPGPWPRSPQGHVWYFGSGPVTTRSQGMATAIEIVDASTLTLQGSINASQPFWSLAVAKNGSVLYGANPAGQTILRFDAISRRQVSEIALPGSKPAVIIPVP